MAFGWDADPEGPAATTQPLPRHQTAVRLPRRTWRLLTTRGRLRVYTCPLCTALVLDQRRHEANHAADRGAS